MYRTLFFNVFPLLLQQLFSLHFMVHFSVVPKNICNYFEVTLLGQLRQKKYDHISSSYRDLSI